jgi:hypothetical protein
MKFRSFMEESSLIELREKQRQRKRNSNIEVPRNTHNTHNIDDFFNPRYDLKSPKKLLPAHL